MHISETILLQFLTDHGLDIFRKEDLSAGLSLPMGQLNYALNGLIKSQQIIQLERGKYCRYGFYDGNVIGTFLAHKGCISYWSAMNHHRLTNQISNVIFVQTDRQKGSKTIRGIRYQYVWLQTHKIFGYSTIGYGNHQYRVADLEKTLIDCFDKPQYSGGYPEIIKAFRKAKPKANKLIEYCKRMNNISLTKRMAYLAQLFDRTELSGFINYAKGIKNEKYNLFEMGGEPKGKTNSEWGLILNVSKREILDMADE